MANDWLLDGTPRPVQEEALRRSYFGVVSNGENPLPHEGGPAKGWAHFLEMRLGKTPLALNEWMLFLRDYDVMRLLVIAPNKYKNGWKEQAEEFGLKGDNICVYNSSNLNEVNFFMRNRKKPGIVIVNYEALVYERHFNMLKRWVMGSKCMLVCDESAIAKNPKAKKFRKLLEISRACVATRILSGLPTPNAVHDLWAQLRLIHQCDTLNFYAFKQHFTVFGGWMGKKAVGIQNADKLNKLLHRCSWRAKQKDWGIKADYDYEEVHLTMDESQAEAYLKMEQDYVLWLTDTKVVTVSQVVARNMKLQQIASGFVLDENGVAHDLIPFNETPKFLDLIDRLDNYELGKVFVAVHHRHSMDQLTKYLEAYNPAYITRGQSPEVAANNEKKFNTDPTCRVMIGQLQSVKYGFKLTGDTKSPTGRDLCASIIFYENTYGLDPRMQCEARPQGGHLTQPIHVLDYYSCDLEKAIVHALQRKISVSNEIMEYYSKKMKKEFSNYKKE